MTIDEALRKVDEYEKWLTDCSKKLIDRLADKGLQVASSGFSQAQYDGTNDVTVNVESRGELTRAVIAVGGATLFIEFGTGVRYPDTSEGLSHGMVHGGYGKGRGKSPKGWHYKGSPGTNGEPSRTVPGLVHTYGNPANLPMYNAVKELSSIVEATVKEVFV